MSFGAISVLAVAFLTLALPVVLLWSVFKLVQAAAWLVAGLFGLVRGLARHLGAFVRGMARDALHFVGGLLTAAVILPLALLNVAIGRWSSASHYGRALEDELMSAAISLYRVTLGHPTRLLGLGVLTDGVERRLPELVAHAPRERKRSRKEAFQGYKVVGTLPAGGSGARLLLAKPAAEKVAAFRKKGFPDPGQVVIKSFALSEGSTLPQIVRESRALEAAGRLGLVLEHELSASRFHYVMPFVPGDDLDRVTHQMHRSAGAEGLSSVHLRRVMGYASDLLGTLDRFHRGGLWHKDIKPTNLIVSADRVHLVDLGLVTPLESGMTLTTHGTEYFRDPELVRLALKGVKVHEVDGVKFDLYSAGAVLFSMIENSFPAHGSLSRISKRCPDALQWIVRRSMADMNSRYGSAAEMLADLRTALAARDPFSVRPADLPSVQGRAPEDVLGTPADAPAPFPGARGTTAAASPEPGPLPSTSSVRVRRHTRRHTLAAGFYALFFGMFMAAAAGLLRDDSAHLDQERVTVTQLLENAGERAREVARRVGAGVRHGHGDEVGAAEPARAMRVGVAEQLWTRRLAPELPPRRAEALASDEARGTVLVLEELPPSADERILAGLRDCLRGRGYEVAGLASDEADDSRTIAWAAGARRAVGLSDPTDGDALARLKSFLDGSSAELGAVLWVTQDESEGHVLYHLVRRSEPERAVPARIVFHGGER